ncbi:AMP-binding protein [Dokdonella koreensis]|uniref:4-coumarate-CoA ligase n=1 Tax=Dokdonella koreensis DS-123 TaxID=1300342 RepID=A0A160DY72_9GAMM|nr:AMP-binding protein [Dokdonella koreensis]ANB19370.1 4-coumarate-CoA ligase [Dokdonella koreensis DS-123]
MTAAPFIALDRLLAEGRAPDHPVALRAGTVLTFADFAAAAAAWRTCFAAAARTDAALYFEDSFDFAAALFGAWHAGTRVWLPADTLPATRARLDACVGAWAGDVPAALAPRTAAAADWNTLDPDWDGLAVYTSGSSGEPVAIGKRLRQVFDEAATLEQAFPALGPAAVVEATVSHQHIYGLLFRVLWPLAAGRPFATARLAFPEDIVAALGRRPAVLVASPAHLKRLPPNLPWDAARTQLRGLFSSGGPLPAEALPDCRRLLGRAPTEVYGSSETGGIAWRRREDTDEAPWQPLPGVAIRIDADQLWVRSPHLADTDWQPSADRARAEGAGFVLLGRSDRIAKIEEKRISLDAIEHALATDDRVEAARLVVLPGARSQIGAVVVPSAAGWACLDAHGRRAFNTALRDALAGHVEASARPRRWRATWALPVNSQGKTTEAALLALFDPRRPFARLLTRDACQARLRLVADATLPWFDGHFPQAPILPGVTQVDWAIGFGRELFALPARFEGLEALKFQQVIVPGADLLLELEFVPERGQLAFRLGSAAGAHASGRIVFSGSP